ncbi:MAG: Sec-independent protein translocase protein TatB [Candidatus Polarisedimenticolia bacterium]
MFGSIGGLELLVLAAIGLLVFGPRRLPEIGRTIGQTLAEFRRAAMEVRTSIEREVRLEELKETGQSIREGLESIPRVAGPLSPLDDPGTPVHKAPEPAGQDDAGPRG